MIKHVETLCLSTPLTGVKLCFLQTDEARPMDTEAQMREASAALKKESQQEVGDLTESQKGENTTSSEKGATLVSSFLCVLQRFA
jgi:hypothetical protein